MAFDARLGCVFHVSKPRQLRLSNALREETYEEITRCYNFCAWIPGHAGPTGARRRRPGCPDEGPEAMGVAHPERREHAFFHIEPDHGGERQEAPGRLDVLDRRSARS